ncbi:hypothetical protein Tco_0223484 [Tanacetum coccineum]
MVVYDRNDWDCKIGVALNTWTGNKRSVLLSYKEYDGGHVRFGSNLKGKVIGGGNISHDSITITNVEHVSGLAFVRNDKCGDIILRLREEKEVKQTEKEADGI